MLTFLISTNLNYHDFSTTKMCVILFHYRVHHQETDFEILEQRESIFTNWNDGRYFFTYKLTKTSMPLLKNRVSIHSLHDSKSINVQ